MGAGFKVASRDLELRGAGNLLGSEQSGHIASVGLELYTQMIDRAVRRIEQAALVSLEEMKVQLGFLEKKKLLFRSGRVFGGFDPPYPPRP